MSSCRTGGPNVFGKMSIVSPHTPLLAFAGDVLPEPRFGVYARRWWLLFILSLVSMNQTLVWMTWSPAVDQVQQLYGWSNATIDLLAAWGPIVYIVFAFCTPALVEGIGLRATITVAAVLTLLGSCVRCFTTQAPYAAILAHFGQILNAFSGPLVAATPSKLSAEWFPPRERATATSIAVIGADIGSGK